MTSKNGILLPQKSKITRRDTLKGLGVVAAGLAAGPGFVRYAQAQSSAPIKIGFQAHRTGIGAAYGRWYERTTTAAAKAINDAGGINGRQIEIVTEDDGTDPKRGAEVVEKFANQHKVDVVYGTLFSHVVVGSAPAAGELKMPYYVVSEGYHVASGKMNRYCFQPGITDVRAQTRAVEDFALGSWIGGVWYGAFPAELGTTELVLTGAALAMLASVVTTFAGLVADPLQLWTGIHRRRVMRLLARLDRAEAGPPLAREHVLARLGDLSDAAMTLWRGMRG